MSHILRPLSAPLYDTEVPGEGLSFFQRPWFLGLKIKHGTFRTRSVKKLIKWGYLSEQVLSDPPDRHAVSPAPAREGDMLTFRYGSGDTVLYLDRHGRVARAFLLSGLLTNDPDGIVSSSVVKVSVKSVFLETFLGLQPHYMALVTYGHRWSRRIKKATVQRIGQAYERAGPLVCMALSAMASEREEVRMSGRAALPPKTWT